MKSSLLIVATLAFSACALRAEGAAAAFSGCHAGLHGGIGAESTKWTDEPPLDVNANIDANGTGNTADTDFSGGVYGAQAGCDWQVGSALVLGGELAGSVSTIARTGLDFFNNTWTLRHRIGWFGDASARAGWAVGPVLLYGRAGLALADNHYKIVNEGTPLGSPNETRIGWMAGGGAEYALSQRFSVFVEGDYFNMGNRTVNFPGSATGPGANAPFPARIGQTFETATAGVNYHF